MAVDVARDPDILRHQEADQFIVEDLINLEILVISEMTIEEIDVAAVEGDSAAVVEDMIVEVSREVQNRAECLARRTARIIKTFPFQIISLCIHSLLTQ